MGACLVESRRKKYLYGRSVGYIFIGILLRIVLAGICRGHLSDLNCFISWADRIAKVGCHSFYSASVFTDYPPGYMYILWVIGKLREIWQLPWDSFANLVLMKIPAIFCDMLTALFLWKIAWKHSEKLAGYAIAVFLFNPAIFINSSIWGQVDSIFTLCVVIVCYLVSERKLPLSYFVFALGILIKPQTLVFTPVILFGVWNQVIKEGKIQIKELFKQTIWACLAIISLLLGMVPFGVTKVITQYVETMTSYPYASVNAYNIWGLLGLNWVSQEGTFLGITYSKIGSIAIFLTVVLAAYLCMKGKEKKECYSVSAAVIIGGMFLFSVRMHERYLYPILGILLFSYVYTKKKEWLISYFLFSIGHFINVVHVLYFATNEVGGVHFVSTINSLFLMGSYGYFIYQIVTDFSIREKKKGIVPVRREDLVAMENLEQKRLKKIDYMIIVILSVFYAGIAFYNLGERQACESSYTFSGENDSVVLDMGQSTYISQISYYLGNLENRQFRLEVAEEAEGPYHLVTEFEMKSVFCWGELNVQDKGQYFRVISNSARAIVGELVFYDFNGKKVTPLQSTPNATELYDETSIYNGRSSFQNGTYFDEIYHARTAYEYLNGWYSYENTHPPLGKIFISLGIKMFGMNPFGWRFMGTLFGVLMIPVIYIFAFQLVKDTLLSSVISILFTFDFMHFVQTRIATIDVFVTFFIMLMYLFMFIYIREDKKKWLALCGVSMGLGVACKWTGAYAGVGLAILFFVHWILKYRNTQDKKEYAINFFKTGLFCVGFFILIPAAIYTLSYLPFRDGSNDGLVARMLKNQMSMYQYHSNVDATHPYSSWWYQWPTMYRPIWYYSGKLSEEIKEGISAFGNPLVWWAGIAAFFSCLYKTVKNKDKTAGFLVVSYLAQYLPWFFVTRITFIYHYFPSVPFVVLMIGYTMKTMEVTNLKKARKYFIGYAVATIVLFAMFYPVLSGMPVSVNYVKTFLRWFDSWVLI